MISLLPFFQWIQDSTVGTSIRESVQLFPIIETIHVIALSASVGLILVTDLRLIGVRLVDERASEVTKQLRLWMLAGFTAMFASGALLFWAEAAKCYQSPTFRAKLVFLLLAGLNALLFETTIGRSITSWDQLPDPPARAKFAGWASLVCWTGVIIFGRWTAYGLR